MNSLEQQFRLAEIEVNKSPLDEKIIGIFRYESETKQRRGPIFLLLVEISSTSYVYEQLLDVLNNTAEQARRLTSGFETDPMARFEKVIQRLNEAIANFVEQSPTPVTWNRVSIFAVELSEAHLCFSGTGRLMNLFLQKQPDGSYRGFDLFGSLEQPAEVNPKKLFSSLVCGDIHPGDILVAGTLNFERLRNELRFVDRLSTLPPVTAAMEIRQDIERRDIPDDFAAVVIASVELPRQVGEQAIPSDMPIKEKSTESIQKMHQEEQETEAILSPAIAPLPKQKFNAKILTNKIQSTVKQILTSVQKRIKQPRSHVKDPVALASLRGMNAGHGSFMTQKRKLTLMAGGCIIIAAVVGTVWYKFAKQASAEQALWNASYDQAMDKKNRAEADVLYNEDDARRLIQEANDILARLDEKNTTRKKAKNDLKQEITVVETKLKHENHVDHPTELAALPAGTAEGSLKHILVFKDRVFALDASGQALLQINPTTKEVKRVGLSAEQAEVVGMAGGTNNVLLLNATAATPTVFGVDPVSSKITSQTITIGKTEQIKSVVMYNKRLYVLDPTSNMIWRHGISEGGYGGPTAYLKQTDVTLANAQGMAIDSSVYITLSNGSIARYLSGVQETWSPIALDPPLESAGGIWTDPDTDRVVVTDPLGKRVLIFRKDGQLISQILSGEFKGPNEVAGDAKNKKIYVADGNRVLIFDLP